jgi:hypothetical protein
MATTSWVTMAPPGAPASSNSVALVVPRTLCSISRPATVIRRVTL